MHKPSHEMWGGGVRAGRWGRRLLSESRGDGRGCACSWGEGGGRQKLCLHAVPLRCERTVCAPLPSPTAVGERGGGGGPPRGRTLWTHPEAQPAQPTSPLQAQGPSPLRLRAIHALPSSPSAQLGPRGPGHSRRRTCHHWVGLVSREVAPQGCVGRGQGGLAVVQGGAVEQGQRVEALGNKEKSLCGGSLASDLIRDPEI